MATSVLKRFIVLLAGWAAGFFVLLLLQSRGSPFPTGAFLPHAAYQALLLGSFPAGIGVAGAVLGRRVDFGAAGVVAGLSLVLAVVVFWMAGWVAPAVLGGAMPGVGEDEPRTLTLPVLKEAVARSVDEARRSGEPGRWIHANALVFEHDRRYAQTLITGLLPLLGMLVGAVGSRIPLVGLRMTYLWGIGLFLLVSSYFAVENGYELVAIRTVGGETPAGLFSVIVPGTLLLAFGAVAIVGAAWPPADHDTEPADGASGGAAASV